MSTTTPHTRNPGNGTASTPGLGRGLMTSKLVYSIRLPFVLGHVGVDKANHIRTNGSFEHSRQGGLFYSFSCLIVHCY